MKVGLAASFALLFCCWLVGFVLGWSLGAPQSATHAERVTAPPATYRPAITITDIAAKRQQIITFMFDGTLPDTLPEQAEGLLIIALPHGFQSVAQILPPSQPNGALVIYHAGHDGTATGQYRQIAQQFNDAGYAVVLMDMPLMGRNAGAVMVDIPNVGTVPISSHEQMAHLSDALRLFIEPVIAVINWAETQGYERIYMLGLSGGGWTTVLTAAIDPRIDASYPVAGSVPLGLRFDTPASWGDWEQMTPAFYQEVATYEDLYILGAWQRRQIQFLNRADPCCFAEPRSVDYDRAVQAFLAGRGMFSVVMVDNDQHRINEAAMRMILEDMAQDD